jgi:signal transduction histidine kinase
MIALMRLVLASSALLIIWIDPSEPDRFVTITYGALILYLAYALFLYLLSHYQVARAGWLRSWGHWVDVAWYTALIALSSGTSSVFFFFYLFSILVASFRWGSASGLRVTVVSSVLYGTVGYVASLGYPEPELNRSLLRPVYLIVFGYMIAYWGGFELTLKKRLDLLREVSTLSNPRFGIEQTINLLMQRLRIFYKAKSCLLILTDREPGTYRLRHCEDGPSPDVRTQHLTTESVQPLLVFSGEHAVLYNRSPHWWSSKTTYSFHDVIRNEKVTAAREAAEKLATMLEAESYITVPLHYRNQPIGRVYFTRHQIPFTDSDLDFLIQAVTHVMPVVENIRLVDRMASDAAREERQTIARDIHDSVIQPYIGLQIGLAGIKQKLSQGVVNVKDDVDQLLEITVAEIDELRGYIKGMKDVSRKQGYFLPAVQRFARRFAEMTGIAIEVEAADDFRINDRLAAEAFQIVAEALSNVRRHTKSTHITVRIERQDNCFVMEFENNIPEAATETLPFTPKSIAARADALGGLVRINAVPGFTTVGVEIPL